MGSRTAGTRYGIADFYDSYFLIVGVVYFVSLYVNVDFVFM